MTVSDEHRDQLTAALDQLTTALQGHLDAVLAGTGEADRGVQAAYTRLRGASEHYEELLFDVTEEVVPWQVPDGPDPAEDEDPDAAGLATAITVLVRRDYDLVDGEALLEAGRDAYALAHPTDPVEAAHADVTHAGRAIYQLLHTHGVDGLAEAAEDAGLEPLGGTVWVQALTDADAETLDDDPFGLADEELLVYRLDEVVEEA